MFSRILAIAVIPAFLTVASCSTAIGDDEEELADAAAELGYVAGALDGLVEFGQPTPGQSSDELLKEAVGENTSSLLALKDYTLKARYVGQFSSVLMCDKDGKLAIAEDAGCTPKELDLNLFSVPPTTPHKCDFELDPATTCAPK